MAEWQLRAGAHAGQNMIRSLTVWEGQLYASTDEGYLLRWDGDSAFVTAAPPLGDGGDVVSIVVYDDAIYGAVSGSTAYSLLRYSGGAEWEAAVTKTTTNHGATALFLSDLYSGRTQSSALDRFDDVDDWEQVAAGISFDTSIRGLAVHDNQLWGLTLQGKLVRWDGTSSWDVIVDESLGTNPIAQALTSFDGSLFALFGADNAILRRWDGLSNWVVVLNEADGSYPVIWRPMRSMFGKLYFATGRAGDKGARVWVLDEASGTPQRDEREAGIDGSLFTAFTVLGGSIFAATQTDQASNRIRLFSLEVEPPQVDGSRTYVYDMSTGQWHQWGSYPEEAVEQYTPVAVNSVSPVPDSDEVSPDGHLAISVLYEDPFTGDQVSYDVPAGPQTLRDFSDGELFDRQGNRVTDLVDLVSIGVNAEGASPSDLTGLNTSGWAILRGIGTSSENHLGRFAGFFNAELFIQVSLSSGEGSPYNPESGLEWRFVITYSDGSTETIRRHVSAIGEESSSWEWEIRVSRSDVDEVTLQRNYTKSNEEVVLARCAFYGVNAS